MNIAVVGSGYVGLVSGTCFAEMGTNVTCVDIDSRKIEDLNNGILPIYEPGLREMLCRNTGGGRLRFSTDLVSALESVDIVFIAVGTPSRSDGSADLSHVLDVARTIGDNMGRYLLVVTKSTVPVGTAEQIRGIILSRQKARVVDIPFDIASNPEFLKEGMAIKDFMSPDRVIIGTDSKRAEELMTKLYRPFLINNFRVIFMDIASAELTKYAANAMLATRISFINDIAALCEAVGADVNLVRKGIGSDTRIGNKFLYPGSGYGGSCFPKDIRALIHTAAEHGVKMRVIEAVDEVNNNQKDILYRKLTAHFGSEKALKGKKIALWGLAFKPETNDVREATSLSLIGKLKDAGAEVSVYDPVAMPDVEAVMGGSVRYGEDMYAAARGADALVLITEWKEFRLPSWEKLKEQMTGTIIIDGRNIYDPAEVREAGFTYYSIGRC